MKTRAKCDQSRNTTHRQSPARLQHLGRQRDPGRLRAALYAALVPALVGVSPGQHGAGRDLVPGAGSNQRRDHIELWFYQHLLGDRLRGGAVFPDRPADQLLRRQVRRRHGLAHARRRLRLYRLDHHLADLRQFHLHLFRAGGGHHGAGHRDLFRPAAGVRLCAVFADRDSHGGLRHHADQSPADVDPAVWIVLLALPYICVLYKEPEALNNLITFAGRAEDGSSFNILLFGAAATVAFSLIAQIGEQVDFLRFLPEKTQANRGRWWTALLLAGPGWILLGGAKMLGGALLAFLAIQHEVPMGKAVEPTQMYLIGYQYVFSNPALVLGAVALFVVVSQIKINVTNAYAGSLAWSNFFARLTHSHPGRVVWLVFNVLIAVLLMELGVFNALEHVLALYSLVAISWIGAVVSDLVINKPLKLSPPHIEFKRAHLYDVNPVGVGSMAIASILSAVAMSGVLGKLAAAMSPFIALGTALVTAPLIAIATGSRYYIARRDTLSDHVDTAHAPHGLHPQIECVICGNQFETPDMAHCPAYQGAICSLCCSLDARCNDRC